MSKEKNKKGKEYIRFFKSVTGKKHPKSHDSFYYSAWVGDELYLPALIAYPESRMEAYLCAVADGVPMMVEFDTLFVPAAWVRKNCHEQFIKWVDIIIKKAEKDR